MEKMNKKVFNEMYDMSFYCGAQPDERGMQQIHDTLTWGRKYLLFDEEGNSKSKIGHFLDNCLVVTSPSDPNKILRCQYNTRRKAPRELPKLEFTSHAKKQMFLRGISEDLVIKTLQFGKMIHYKDRKGNLRDACLFNNISVGATPSDNEDNVLVVVTVMRLSPISELNFISLCRNLKGRLGDGYRFSIIEKDEKNEHYFERDGRSELKLFENFEPKRGDTYTFKFTWPTDISVSQLECLNEALQEELDLFRRLGFEGNPEVIKYHGIRASATVEWNMSDYDLDRVWGWGRK